MSRVRQRFLLAALVAAVTIAHAQSEPFRPQFHVTPERNWMNDPNGLVFYDGSGTSSTNTNPSGDKWGDMPWGHVCRRGRGAKQCSPSSSSPLRDRACSV